MVRIAGRFTHVEPRRRVPAVDLRSCRRTSCARTAGLWSSTQARLAPMACDTSCTVRSGPLTRSATTDVPTWSSIFTIRGSWSTRPANAEGRSDRRRAASVHRNGGPDRERSGRRLRRVFRRMRTRIIEGALYVPGSWADDPDRQAHVHTGGVA